MARSRLTFHRWALGVTLSIIVLMAIPPARQLYAQQRQIEAGEAKLATLRAENSRLQERLERLNDPEYIEKLAREQLGMVRPGEIAYVIVPPEASIESLKPPAPKPKPWYERAWNWFKDLVGAT